MKDIILHKPKTVTFNHDKKLVGRKERKGGEA
jgi:hypothetical protein